jgi:hypothetical protein
MKSCHQEIAPDYARYRRVHPEVLRRLIATGPIHGDSRSPMLRAAKAAIIRSTS